MPYLSSIFIKQTMDFTAIYKQYSEKIYRVCLGFLNDSERAKDLTQETFIAVWEHLDGFRQEAAVGTWIYRIATNKCLRSIEKDKKQKKIKLPTYLEDQMPPKEQEEKLIALRYHIAQLSEIDRIIISLYMEDLPQENIATITGLTHSNIRVKIHRIKGILLKKFKENG